MARKNIKARAARKPRKLTLRKRGPLTAYRKASSSNVIPSNGLSASTARGPLAVKQRAEFIYSGSAIQLNAGGTGNLDHQVFSCNGLYDPDTSGIGHQPRGFDQLMTLYDHYVVTKCRLTVMYSNSDASNAQLITVTTRDSPTLSSALDNIIEQRYLKAVIVGPKGSGTATGSLDIEVDVPKFLGRNAFGDSQLKGSAGANPLESCYFHISSVAASGIADPGAIDITCRLVYTTTLVEPRQPASS